MDHLVRSFANANASVRKTPAEKKCIKAVRVDGPQYWDGSLPTNHRDKMVLQRHAAGISYYHFAVPRVDDTGAELKHLDHHSYVIGWNVYFRSNKARDLFFEDLEFAEMNNTMTRNETESRADFLDRFKSANRKTAIRRSLDRIARAYGRTLANLEQSKLLYVVAGRSS